MTGIVDFGAGNLKSVTKAFEHLGGRAKIISSAKEFETVKRIVLPGVGSFGFAAAGLEERGLLKPVREWIEADRPFLGICLGLQLLYDASEESPDAVGLGFLQGACRRFRERKVPQIGWNSILKVKESPLLDGVGSGEYFYFVHAYYALPKVSDCSIATTRYGAEYASIVGKGNVYAVQFHPEKSGDNGIRLLSNWVRRC